MERLDLKLLQASIKLETTKIKVLASLQDIEKKHPGRVDIIESMSETLEDIKDVQACFSFLNERYNSHSIEIHKIQVDLDNAKSENRRLKNELNNIKKNLSL